MNTKEKAIGYIGIIILTAMMMLFAFNMLKLLFSTTYDSDSLVVCPMTINGTEHMLLLYPTEKSPCHDTVKYRVRAEIIK
jgi:hypothetical protein